MKKRIFSWLLTIVMVMSLLPTAAFAAQPRFDDIDGHWAEDIINRWASHGIVSGVGTGFDPNGEMTRAQAAAVFAQFFNLSKKADVSGYSDVEDTWYTDYIAMCVAAGIMSGVGDGKMDPNGTLTREQMFTMFCQGAGIAPQESTHKDYSDAEEVSDWAEGYVNALLNLGYVSGVTDTELAPDADINRASVMALIDNSVATYVTEDGEVSAPEGNGLVVVVAENVTITGEFSGTVLAVGGDTNITVEEATSDAQVVVASGSESVTVSGEFSGIVTVAANDTTVTVENATEDATVVVAAANTTVDGDIKGTVEVAEGAESTTVAGTVETVAVTGTAASVEVSGKVETVEVAETATGSSVAVSEDAAVGTLTTEAAGSAVSVAGTVNKVEVAESAGSTTVDVAKDAAVGTLTTEAADSAVSVAGTVNKVEVAETAGNTTVTTESTAKVQNVTTSAADTTVAGDGKVTKVEATESATGTTVNTSGSKVENNSEESVTVGTGSVASGSTGTSKGEDSKPSSGTVSSGSSSSDDDYDVHYCSYTSTVTTQPTCVATGVKTYTCSGCGSSYTETIPATGVHTYDATTLTYSKATEGESVTETYTKVCTVCSGNETATETEIAAATTLVVGDEESFAAAVSKSGTITVVVNKNIAITAPLTISGAVVINLEDNVALDASALTADRPFHMGEGASLTINADDTNNNIIGAHGWVNVPSAVNDATIIINGGKYTGTSANGAFIRLRSGNENVTVTLTDVTYNDAASDGYIISTDGFGGTGNVTVTRGSYAANYGFQAPAGTKISGATITTNGAAVQAMGENVVVDDCDITVDPGVTVVYAPGCAIAVSGKGSVTAKNSTISGSMQAVYYVYNSGGTIVAENNVTTGVTATERGFCVDDYKSQGKGDDSSITVDGKLFIKDGLFQDVETNIYTVSDDAALADVIESGASTVQLADGTFIIPDEAQGKTLTIIGSGNTIIATQDDGSYEGCDYSLDGSTVTFENITINTDSKTYTGYARLNATYKNCTINGTYTLYGDSVFDNCTFNVSGDVYNIWTWGAANVEFNQCTFNTSGKALLVYANALNGGGNLETVKITNCVFNDDNLYSDVSGKAAVEIGNDYGKSYELIINNITVNGFDVNSAGISTGTNIWANKNSMGTDTLNVVIDGVDVY